VGVCGAQFGDECEIAVENIHHRGHRGSQRSKFLATDFHGFTRINLFRKSKLLSVKTEGDPWL